MAAESARSGRTVFIELRARDRARVHGEQAGAQPPGQPQQVPVVTEHALDQHEHLVGTLALAHQHSARLVVELGRGVRDGGGFGSIIGRNSFQRPKGDAINMLHKVMDIYAGKPVPVGA